MAAQTIQESITDAIRYWEPRRLVYNGVLVVIVLVYFWIAYQGSKAVPSLDSALHLLLLAILANVAYCAAYIADIFAQWSSYRDLWKRSRWILFAVGMLFAAILTRFLALGMLWPCSG